MYSAKVLLLVIQSALMIVVMLKCNWKFRVLLSVVPQRMGYIL